MDAGQGVEARDQQVAPRLRTRRSSPRRRARRARAPRGRRPWRTRSRSRSRGPGSSAAASTSSRGPEQVAEPPAGHRVGLRERADDHDGVGEAAGQRCGRARRGAVVDEALVGLVGDHQHAARGAALDDRGQRSAARSRPPVGLHGELSDHGAGARGERREHRARRRIGEAVVTRGRRPRRPRRRRSGSARECSTQAGVWSTTSCPSSKSASATSKSAPLPPTVISVWSAVQGAP